MVPDGPTEDMLAILGCQNGAQVEQYLKQVLVGHNVSIEPGLCSAINKGIFVHADDGSMPRHFFLFFDTADEGRCGSRGEQLHLAFGGTE